MLDIEFCGITYIYMTRPNQICVIKLLLTIQHVHKSHSEQNKKKTSINHVNYLL